jgi:hypothetical protein
MAKPARRLLIVHTPGAEARSDWETVAIKITRGAPEIEVVIATNPPVAGPWVESAAPLLIVSPHQLRKPWVGRGRVYSGVDYDKVVQAERLAAARIPTPLTFRLSELARAAVDLGKYAIVKPAIGHLGDGVRLVPVTALREMAARLSPQQAHRLVVQPYIEHADLAGRLFEYRVLTFFGRLVYSSRNRALVAHPPLERVARGGLIASNVETFGQRVRDLTSDTAVVDLGLMAARAFPELPVVAADIIVERDTGRLLVLEVNPKGESWHLSSDFAMRTFDPEHRKALYRQHDALKVAADALIEKARQEAA